MIYYALLFSPHWLLISSLLLASPDATHFLTFLFLSLVAAFAYCAYFSVLSKSFSCFCQLNLFTIKKEKKTTFFLHVFGFRVLVSVSVSVFFAAFFVWLWLSFSLCPSLSLFLMAQHLHLGFILKFILVIYVWAALFMRGLLIKNNWRRVYSVDI